MSKRKKQKFKIPHTTEEFRKNGQRSIGAGWNNYKELKKEIGEMSKEDIENLVNSIYEYIEEKDLENPGSSWQDFLLIDSIKRIWIERNLKNNQPKENNSTTAYYRLFYPYLPETILETLDDEIEEIVEKLKGGKNWMDVSIEDVIRQIAIKKSYTLTPEDLAQKNVLKEIQQSVKELIKRSEKSKILYYLEALIIGLITNGLFELLKSALESLSGRAPYTEAQIYEVECDLYHQHEKKWQNLMESILPPYLDNPEEKKILYVYIYHSLSKISVIGSDIDNNPIFKTHEN